MKTQKDASEGNDLVLQLLQLTNMLLRRLTPLAGRTGITPQQAFVLSILASSENTPTLAGIARQMMVSKQNVTGMIARLEAAGMVKRSGDSGDLRATRISLTRRGAQTWERIGPAYEAWLATLLAQIPENDRRSLRRTLPRLLALTAIDE